MQNRRTVQQHLPRKVCNFTRLRTRAPAPTRVGGRWLPGWRWRLPIGAHGMWTVRYIRPFASLQMFIQVASLRLVLPYPAFPLSDVKRVVPSGENACTIQRCTGAGEDPEQDARIACAECHKKSKIHRTGTAERSQLLAGGHNRTRHVPPGASVHQRHGWVQASLVVTECLTQFTSYKIAYRTRTPFRKCSGAACSLKAPGTIPVCRHECSCCDTNPTRSHQEKGPQVLTWPGPYK